MKKSLDRIIDGIGLTVISLLSLGYIILRIPFAEIHIQFPFFTFPVFIGEIALFICLILAGLKYWNQNGQIVLKKQHYFLWTFLAFIFLKAIWGYFSFGELALRHAALFYYPLYALLVAYFYNKNLLNSSIVKIIAIIGLCMVFNMTSYSRFWAFPLFLIAIGVAFLLKPLWVKVTCMLGVVLFADYVHFFRVPRMMIVGNFLAVLFLFVYLFSLPRIKPQKKFWVLLFLVVVFGGGAYKFIDRNAFKSIINVKRLMNCFQRREALIQQKEARYKQKPLEVNLYNPSEIRTLEQDKDPVDQYREKTSNAAERPIIRSQETASQQMTIYQKETIKQSQLGARNEQTLQSEGSEDNGISQEAKAYKDRKLGQAYGNAVFRLLIWRDAFVELFREKKVLGFHFGKPYRSRSLEILHMGISEWQRDGWIAMHNSYIHILYRAGLLGLCFIIYFIYHFFQVVGQLLKHQSWTGGLFVASAICWFGAANFLIILEVPYTAIPIWSLWGGIYAFAQKRV
jgi:hypothetical protein